MRPSSVEAVHDRLGDAAKAWRTSVTVALHDYLLRHGASHLWSRGRRSDVLALLSQLEFIAAGMLWASEDSRTALLAAVRVAGLEAFTEGVRRSVRAAVRNGAVPPERVASEQAALFLVWMGLVREALGLQRLVMRQSVEQFGPGHPETARALFNLGHAQGQVGFQAAAVRSLSAALKLLESQDEFDGDAVAVAKSLGWLLMERGRLDRAATLLENHAARAETFFGGSSDETRAIRSDLAVVLLRRGDTQRGIGLLRDLHAAEVALHGREHPRTADSLHTLAYALEEVGALDEAEQAYRDSLAIKGRLLGPVHPSTVGTLNNLAWMTLLDGRHAEARTVFERLQEAWSGTVDFRRWWGPLGLALCDALDGLGFEGVDRCLDDMARQLGDGHARVLLARERRAQVQAMTAAVGRVS